jgi:hypothetical protein
MAATPTDTGSSTAAVTDERHRQIEDLAHLLDSAFRVPGTNRRFGIDGLLGLVPGVGDAAGLVLSSGVILQAVRLGARGATVGRMVLNVGIDAVFGSVPVLGWFFDFAFKANNRNVALLEAHVDDPEGTRRRSAGSIRRTIIGAVIGLVATLLLLAAFVVWVLTLVF